MLSENHAIMKLINFFLLNFTTRHTQTPFEIHLYYNIILFHSPLDGPAGWMSISSSSIRFFFFWIREFYFWQWDSLGNWVTFFYFRKKLKTFLNNLQLLRICCILLNLLTLKIHALRNESIICRCNPMA